ncbi:MAG: alkyl sulfatase dimerization domain-containing protein [Promethearchaeota archaeon]
METIKKDIFYKDQHVRITTFGDGSCHLIRSFGNIGVIETNEGLVLFDITGKNLGAKSIYGLREITDKPIKYIIYSHGHFDHCFGYEPFINEIKEKGWDMPQIIAHENCIKRFEKYKMLEEYHVWINSMQFSSIPERQRGLTTVIKILDPTIIIRGNDEYKFNLGNNTFEIYHDIGETDDSLWMYVPEKNTLFTGDLMISAYPNVGNPYKVQRYPKHWALAMEKMMKKKVKYLVPGHGRLIEGEEQVKEALSITAEAMHFVHDEIVKRMNQGKWFEQIYHEMLELYPEKFKQNRFLQWVYGSYQFAIHAVYRLYHGWYDTGNPTDLFPSKSTDIAKTLLEINSEEKYLNHAKKLYDEKKLQLALHILDIILKAEDTVSTKIILDAYNLKYKVLKEKVAQETSLIARNIMNNGANEIKTQLKEIEKHNK